MTTLTDTPAWRPAVRYFKENAVLTGGPDCEDNEPIQDLADRTAWLKAQVDKSATESQQGKVELATAAETTAGTDTTRATHPAGVKAAVMAGINTRQPLDTTLTAIAALTTAANQLIYATNADTFATTALTAFARSLLDDADAAAARATLGAAPLASPALSGTPTAPTAAAGTNTTQLATTAFVQAGINTRQPLDTTLTAIAALTTAANQLIYATGADTFATTALTAFARSLLDDADAAAARATLGAAPLASPALSGTPTAPTAAAGTNNTQIATTAFVQSTAATPAASNTVAGKIEIATAAEAQAMSSDLLAITPAGLASAFKGANQSLSASGYQKLPGGLILQWGSVASIGAMSSTAVTFPVSFPSVCVSAVSVPTDGNQLNVIPTGIRASGFTMNNKNTQSAITSNWIAIGY